MLLMCLLIHVSDVLITIADELVHRLPDRHFSFMLNLVFQLNQLIFESFKVMLVAIIDLKHFHLFTLTLSPIHEPSKPQCLLQAWIVLLYLFLLHAPLYESLSGSFLAKLKVAFQCNVPHFVIQRDQESKVLLCLFVSLGLRLRHTISAG